LATFGRLSAAGMAANVAFEQSGRRFSNSPDVEREHTRARGRSRAAALPAAANSGQNSGQT